MGLKFENEEDHERMAQLTKELFEIVGGNDEMVLFFVFGEDGKGFTSGLNGWAGQLTRAFVSYFNENKSDAESVFECIKTAKKISEVSDDVIEDEQKMERVIYWGRKIMGHIKRGEREKAEQAQKDARKELGEMFNLDFLTGSDGGG